MSVMMVLRMNGDPKRLEEVAAADPGRIKSISDAAQGHGLVAHRFYGTGNEIIVVDEWPDEQSFQAFFQEKQGDIGSLMQEVGVSGQPTPEFWHKLDSRDEVGWGA
jgi:quinol monooxygenase YgiN